MKKRSKSSPCICTTTPWFQTACFADNGVLRFKSAPPPTVEEVAELVELLRRRILKRMLYVLRPALSLKQLMYAPEQDLVTYRRSQGQARFARAGAKTPRPLLGGAGTALAPETGGEHGGARQSDGGRA